MMEKGTHGSDGYKGTGDTLCGFCLSCGISNVTRNRKEKDYE